MRLNEAQKAVRLASMEDQGNEDDDHGVDSDEHEDKSAEGLPWTFHDLQGSGRQGMPTSPAIRDLYARYNA